MGTLTANQSRLPEYCEHKLPTSCRLSSIPDCCACADERSHAPTYSTYIDGIGFVPRGNRWQRYCWYCKEFWENRVAISGLRPAQTKIPEVPDQTAFLQRWYEFHRGYRLVLSSDGREERIAVLGEDFKDVSPGCMPRTLEELRLGLAAEEVSQVSIQNAVQVPEETGPALEETLEQMLAEDDNEERSQRQTTTESTVQPLSQSSIAPSNTPNPHAQVMNPAPSRDQNYQMRRIAALRRELTRMRSGIQRVISGLSELGENISDEHDSTGTLRTLDAILESPSLAVSQEANQTASQSAARMALNIQQRIEEARTRYSAASQARSRAATELEAADNELRSSNQHLQQLQREQRTMENYTRVFGTREEMVAQGENYQSPIGSMFSRAYERFRAAEDVRREQRTLRQVLEDEERINTDEAVSRRLEELESRERDVWGVPRPPMQSQEWLPRLGPRRAAPSDLDMSNSPATQHPYLAGLDDHVVPPPPSGADFPQDMQAAVRIARATELLEQARRDNEPEEYGYAPQAAVPASDEFSEDAWWHEDAETIIRALTTDDGLRQNLNFSIPDAAVLLAYFVDDMVSESDRMTIDGLLRNPIAIWRTGLPEQWLRRRQHLLREPNGGLFFTGSGGSGGNVDWAAHHNPHMRTEVVAQAYMISTEVRRFASDLTPPERLQMLYRLQAGRRTQPDVATLEGIQDNPELFRRAKEIYHANIRREFELDAEQQEQADYDRAQNGRRPRMDPTAGLNESASRAFALAAGRQAFQTGSQALIEQMATVRNTEAGIDAGTRAAMTRLNQLNERVARVAGLPRYEHTLRSRMMGRGLSEDAPSDSEGFSSQASSRSSSAEPAVGLDAQDAGRPPPKSEEEMQVSMECKVCYSQMAEIACLPCGHLVMCKWCSDQHSPCLAHDHTRPRRVVGCPVCRKTIRQKVRVFRA